MNTHSPRRVLTLVLLPVTGLLLIAATAAQDAGPPVRLGLRARSGGVDRLTPLRYQGGFETKTLLYETLVRRGPDGRIEAGLASRWQVEDGGKAFRFELREGALFHDGRPVTAAAVKVHFQRWVSLPEHDWLAVNRHITGVEVTGEREFVVRLDQPYPLLADLLAINPCAIVGPGARDWEGEFTKPVGTGPFRFVSMQQDGAWRIEPVRGEGPAIEVHPYPRPSGASRDDAAPIEALRAGAIDAFVGGWDEDLPAERLDELARDPRFVVQTAPGSSVVHLTFRLTEGPTQALAVRQRIAAAIDRGALIDQVEGGRAEPCTTWAAPSLAFWPHGPGIAAPAPDQEGATAEKVALRIAAGRGNGRAERVANAVAGQLRARGFTVDVVAPAPRPDLAKAAASGTTAGAARQAANREVRARAESADLVVEITHGAPYDPQQTLVSRFGPVANKNADEPRPRNGVDADLLLLVAATMQLPTEELCAPVYAQIQALMDQRALVVPLYSPLRVALHRADLEGIGLGPDVYHVDLTGLRRLPAR